MIKPILEKVFNMNQRERMIRLCTLAVKEHLGILNSFEMLELATIQSIREMNGECDAVRKMWEEDEEELNKLKQGELL